MRFLLTIILIGTLISGCTTSPSSNSSNTNIASVAPEGKVTEDAASGVEPLSPGLVMTVNSPAIQLTPIQGNTSTPSTPTPHSTKDWQTFTSKTLGIALDYPVDWSASEQVDGAIFTSPLNSVIELKVANVNGNGNEIRIGNQRCTSQTNAYGLVADICVESGPFNYSAKFTLKSLSGSEQWITLTTTTRNTGEIFHAMYNSVRREG